MTLEHLEGPDLTWLDAAQDDDQRYALGRFIAERLVVVSEALPAWLSAAAQFRMPAVS